MICSLLPIQTFLQRGIKNLCLVINSKICGVDKICNGKIYLLRIPTNVTDHKLLQVSSNGRKCNSLPDSHTIQTSLQEAYKEERQSLHHSAISLPFDSQTRFYQFKISITRISQSNDQRTNERTITKSWFMSTLLT